MRWYVPTYGDRMFLGVRSPEGRPPRTMDEALLALGARIRSMCTQGEDWRGPSRELYDLGHLCEPPDSKAMFCLQISEDPRFWDLAQALGAASPYLPATEDEVEELEDMSLAFWPLRASPGGLE